MRSFFKTLVSLTLSLLILAVGTAIGGYFWLQSSLPDLSGEKRLAGLKTDAEILRDRDGLVTIRAENEHDAYMALGFAHAQDRLWQMDSMRRAGAGRLSEVSGPATLGIDRFMRTLGLYRLAEANYRHLSDETKAALQAYSAGVNRFLETRQGPLPPEFLILGYEPAPWSPIDSLVWGRLMAFQLSDNLFRELQRQRFAAQLAPEDLEALWPQDPRDPVSAPTPHSQAALGAPGSLPLPWPLAPKDASNAWAVTGDHSTTGGPILANDPHLALEAPGPWYLVRMETPDFTWVGATTPGVPFMILGHNGHLAWAFTTTHSDTQDLFIERVLDDNPARYLTPDGSAAFESREEIIAVKDEEPYRLLVRNSRHGPVISDVLRRKAPLDPGHVLSLAWTALREDDRTAEALYRLNHARDWTAFEAALRDFHSPQQTVVMADRAGTIALIAPGRVPIRKTGDGRMPVPGWTGTHDWLGLVPFDALPRNVNPPDKRLVAANNRLVDEDYPYLITADWPQGTRAQRLQTHLAAFTAQGVEAHQALQMDSVSPAALELRPYLLETEATDPRAQEALALLSAWDGSMDRNLAAPLIFHAWIKALHRHIYANLPTASQQALQQADFQRLTQLMATRPNRWCRFAVKSTKKPDCAGVLRQSLEEALDSLSRAYGEEIAQWRWGAAHKAHFTHPIFDRIPFLNQWLKIETESSGGAETINRGTPSMRAADEARFPNIHGPGFRAVYDLTDLDNSRFLLATGQSGNPFSRFYGNFLSRWRDGVYVKLAGGPAQKAEHRLQLHPKTKE